MGIAKRSGADLWQHFTTALHENTQTGPGEARRGETRRDEARRTQAMKTQEQPMTQKAQRLAACNSIGQQFKYMMGEVLDYTQCLIKPD